MSKRSVFCSMKTVHFQDVFCLLLACDIWRIPSYNNLFQWGKERIYPGSQPLKIQWQWIWGSLPLHSPNLILIDFVLFFCLKTPQNICFSLALCSTTHHLRWECTKRETYSPWSRQEYTTSILELEEGFQAIAKIRFSTLVKFLFSQRNWHWVIAF